MHRQTATPERPTYRPVYKALHRRLTVWGVERRLFFLAMLMGAATFNLFYSFLAGLLMFGSLYGFALVGHAARPGHAAHPAVVVTRAATLRPGKHDRADVEVAHGEAATDPPRLQRGRGSQLADRPVGLRRRHHVPDEERPRRRGLSAAGAGRRGPDARPAPAARPPVRGGLATARRALPRLPVRRQADRRSIRGAAVPARQSRTRRSSVAPTT